MISIIICSRFQSISKELKDNIENTVGVVHEIICIDNSKSQYDIFSAYNEGVKRSQYPLLCFMLFPHLLAWVVSLYCRNWWCTDLVKSVLA